MHTTISHNKRLFEDEVVHVAEGLCPSSERYSLLCRWAEDCIKPPLIYVVLIALQDLEKPDLILIQKHLEGKLPTKKPERWQRSIVDGCIAVNLETWHTYFPQFPVTRLSADPSP